MNKKKKYSIYVKLLWIIFVVPFIFGVVLFVLISKGNLGFMPSFEELENPKSNLASEIYSADQQLLGKYYFQNRTFISFEDLPKCLVNALIATEDIRYEEHSGIDIRGLGRVFFKTIILGRSTGGGSTITQQLAKNLFPRDTTRYSSKIHRISKIIVTKFKEWVTSVKLERNYTKEEILVMYLNTVPFGSQAFGIKSASRIFFGVSPDSLKLEQAAMLVGVLKAQTKYSPVRNPEQALKRRNIVLSQMNKYNFITQSLYDSVSVLPLNLNYKQQTHIEGLAPYFREYLRTTLHARQPVKENYFSYKKYLEDSLEWQTNPLYGWCNKNLKPDGSSYDLYKDGLKIYTTINSRMQRYAEEAVAVHLGKDLQIAFFKEQKGRKQAPFAWNISEKQDLTEEQIERIMFLSMKRTERYRALKNKGLSLDSIQAIFNIPTKMKVFSWNGEIDTIMTPIDSIRYYKHFLQAGFMSMEPQTGYVRAYVGGINYKHFKFDHVKIGKRQVGSTFKPFLYTLAMQEGFSPCYKVPNIPTSFYLQDTVYTPKFSTTKRSGQMVTLKYGLANSLNQISAWVLKQFSPQAVVNLTHKMGVKSYILPVYSICVGSPEILLYEMVGAFSTYANKGVYTEPIFVTRIEDKHGNIIASFKPEKIEAISEETAYLMLNLLRGVVQFGTSCRLGYRYGLTNEIAAKTGTTNNQSDGWFIGITPGLVSGVWVGGEERSIHFIGLEMGQGATMALPIWAYYMQKVYADESLGILPAEKFERYSKKLSVEIDCERYEQKKFNEDDENFNLLDDDFF